MNFKGLFSFIFITVIVMRHKLLNSALLLNTATCSINQLSKHLSNSVQGFCLLFRINFIAFYSGTLQKRIK